jgi:hypothetical protein
MITSFYISLTNNLLCVRLSRNLSTNDAKQKAVRGLEKDVLRRKAQLHEMEQSLPKQNGMYLKIILGNVNVSILNKNDKYVYL